MQIANTGFTFTGGGIQPGDSISVSNGGSVDVSDFGVLQGDWDLMIDSGTLTEQANGRVDIASNKTLTAQNNAVVDLLGTAISSRSISDGQTFNVLSGADVTIAALISVGANATQGTIDVSGSGSSFTSSNTSAVKLGDTGGTADVTFRDGAQGTFHKVTLADDVASSADFRVESGAMVTMDELWIGKGETAAAGGVVTVTGTNSSIIQNGTATLDIGADVGTGLGKLEVVNGGTYSTGTGLTTIHATGVLTIEGGTLSFYDLLVDGGQLNAFGTLQGNGGSIQFLSGLVSYLGDLRVGVGGLLGDGDLELSTSKSLKLTGATTIDMGMELALTGGSLTTSSLVIDGIFDFQQGTLRISSPAGLLVGPNGMLGATVTLNPAKELLVDQTTTIAPGGQLIVDGASFSSGLITIQSNGGLVVGPSGFTNTSEVELTGSSASISGSSLANQTVIRGTGRVDAILDNQSTGELRTGVGQRMVITGTGNLNAGRIEAFGGEFEFAHDLVNQSDGVIQAAGVTTLRFNGGLTNHGAIGLTAGTHNMVGPITNEPAGQVLVAGASFATLFDELVQNGTFSIGTGSHTVFLGQVTGAGAFLGGGTAEFAGGYSPGNNSPAVVEFGGNAVIAASSTLTIELGGANPATSDYDQLSINDAATLNGTLDVVPLGTYFDPTVSGHQDVFTVLTAATVAGGFAAVNYDGAQLSADIGPDANGSFRDHVGGGLFRSISYSDTDIQLTNYLALAGDANGDGSVNSSDAAILGGNFGMLTGATWTVGDFNADGAVNSSDAAILGGNFGQMAGVSSVTFPQSTYIGSAETVPEPGTSMLLSLGGLLLRLMRRKRSA